MTVPFAKGIYRIETLPFSDGHTLRLFCLEGCPTIVDVSEDHPDRPLGQVSNDNDDLFFYLSSTKAGHWVRVWHLTDMGAERIGEVFSPRRPDLITDENGHTIIRSDENGAAAGTSRGVEWRYISGKYVRYGEASSN